MTDKTDRIDVSIPLGNDVSVGHAVMSGPNMHHMTVRGHRGQAETIVLRLLAELTGDYHLFGSMEFADIRMALRTLGEINCHGLDVDLEDELSEPQKDVLNQMGRLYAADMAEQGMSE